MASRLGAEYPVEIETISKPKAEFQTIEYAGLDLPPDVREEELVGAIRKHLDLPTLEPEKKGIIGRLFDK
jgi:hypothetical protein